MHKFANIKVILFDIDDTLFASTKFSSLARQNAINAMINCGMDTDYNSAHQCLLKIIKKYGSNYSWHFNRLVEHFNCKNKNYCIASAIWAYHNTKLSIAPFQDVRKTLDRLNNSGYILCVASRGKSIKQWDKLIRLGLDKCFKEVFVSFRKDDKFYLKICNKMKVSPSSVLMIGDNPKTDISPAKKAGLKTVRIKIEKHANVTDHADACISDFSDILNFLL